MFFVRKKVITEHDKVHFSIYFLQTTKADQSGGLVLSQTEISDQDAPDAMG
jgi:hypothetical protein